MQQWFWFCTALYDMVIRVSAVWYRELTCITVHFNHVVIFTLYVFVCLVFPASPVEFCRKCSCHLQSSFEEVTVNITIFHPQRGSKGTKKISSAPPMPSTLSAAPELGNDYFLSVVEMPSSLRLASMLQVHFHNYNWLFYLIIIDYFT